MRSIKSHIIVFITLALQTAGAIAQQQLQGQFFVKDTNLYIRWIPVKEENWTTLCKEGFDVYRIEWNAAGIPDTAMFSAAVKLTHSPVKALAEKSGEWSVITKETEEALLIQSVLFDPNYKNKKPNVREYTYSLCLLSADFYPQIAKSLGLSYTIRIPTSGKYAYMIKPAGKIKASPYIFVCDYSAQNSLAAINTLSLKEKRGQVKLSWEIMNLRQSYSGYNVERSENGSAFSKLNKKPYVILTTDVDQNKNSCTFVDSTAKPGIEYTYRIYGISFFGFNGEFSNEVKVKVTEPVLSAVFPDSARITGIASLSVFAHVRETKEKSFLTQVALYKSTKENEAYEKIVSSDYISKKQIVLNDSKATSSAYYKVCLYNASGDSIMSGSLLFVMPDTIPPARPTGFLGSIDSTGKVILKWNSNMESDLKGYRVFRANHPKEGFADVSNKVLTEVIFEDNVEVNTLTEEVYYLLAAIDESYNKSQFSDTLKLYRPDRIKPEEALCKTIVHNDSAIVVQWVPSSSKDVEKYIIYRTEKGKSKVKIKEFEPKDSLVLIDIHLEYDAYYQYEIETIDDAGNKNFSVSPLHYFTTRIRKPVTDISYTINKEERCLKLNWTYAKDGIESYVIYKSKKGEQPRIYKTVKAGTESITDKELYIGNTYIYRIKANYISGAESKLSKDVEVEF